MVETAFSTIKRMFGEFTLAIMSSNMVNAMMIKISCITCLEDHNTMNIMIPREWGIMQQSIN